MISAPSWYQEIVKGEVPDTLQSSSPDLPTMLCMSFNFRVNVGGIILSVKMHNQIEHGAEGIGT